MGLLISYADGNGDSDIENMHMKLDSIRSQLRAEVDLSKAL